MDLVYQEHKPQGFQRTVYRLVGTSVDGSFQEVLTDWSSTRLSPTWSPNGELIAITANFDKASQGVADGGTSQLYVISEDGSELDQLTRSESLKSDAAWSPDGRWIAYVEEVDSTSAIFLIRPDGTGRRLLVSHSSENIDPTWHPEGRRVIFVTDRHGHLDLYAINPDGSGEQRLTTNPDADWMPTWAPNSFQVAYVSTRNNERPHLYVMEEDGSDKRLLSASPNARDPMWSLDGKALVFSYGGTAAILRPTKTTHTIVKEGFAGRPRWSPDGDQIAFVWSYAEGYPAGVYVVNSDRSDRHRISTSEHASRPVWRPILREK